MKATERGHPVRLSAQREQPFKRESLRGSERASPAGGQDVRDPTTLVARAGMNNNIVNSSQALCDAHGL
jgi:hypothetical protein